MVPRRPRARLRSYGAVGLTRILTIIRGAVAAALVIFGTSALAADDELVLGANIGNVPWEFAERDGTFVGFEIDLVREVAKRLGRPATHRQHSVCRFVFGGSVRPYRHCGLIDDDHREASLFGVLRSALL